MGGLLHNADLHYIYLAPNEYEIDYIIIYIGEASQLDLGVNLKCFLLKVRLLLSISV